jgi:hypothetical protein
VIDRLLRAAEEAGEGEALDWTDFFVAEAGAAAALAGLAVVAISINVGKILGAARLVARAALSVAMFVNVLMIATFGLIPGVDEATLGALVLIPAGVTWIGAIRMIIRYGFDPDRRLKSLGVYVLWHVALIPILIGAVLLIVDAPSGMYWISAGIAACFLVGLLNAWVLLVEILR